MDPLRRRVVTLSVWSVPAVLAAATAPALAASSPGLALEFEPIFCDSCTPQQFDPLSIIIHGLPSGVSSEGAVISVTLSGARFIEDDAPSGVTMSSAVTDGYANTYPIAPDTASGTVTATATTVITIGGTPQTLTRVFTLR